MGRRVNTRRTLRHLLLASSGTLLFAIVYLALDRDDAIWRASMAGAYAALIFLVITLCIGPFQVLSARPNPMSTYFRRDFGIWTGILALLHVVMGLQVHFRGKMWLYFVFPAQEAHLLPLRTDPFGAANYLGAMVTLIVVLLLALSNNKLLRLLGPRRWKRYQRLNYLLVVLLIGHGVAYQLLEKRELTYVVFFSILLLVALLAQTFGFFGYRRRGR